MKITKKQLKQIVKEEYRRIIKESSADDPLVREVVALYQDGHGARAASEMLSQMYDEMDLQGALDMGMFGPSWIQSYVLSIIDEMREPSGLHDEPDRYGGRRNRRY